MGGYIGFRVYGLGPKSLKGFLVDYIGNYHMAH